MPRRPHDWFRQAGLDLEAAEASYDRSRFEWTCFAAQQAAEKALKALHEAAGVEAWGHSARALLEALDDVPGDVLDSAKELDVHYIPARYPNAHPAGAPGDAYTRGEAERALANARRVIEFARGRLPQA